MYVYFIWFVLIAINKRSIFLVFLILSMCPTKSACQWFCLLTRSYSHHSGIKKCIHGCVSESIQTQLWKCVLFCQYIKTHLATHIFNWTHLRWIQYIHRDASMSIRDDPSIEVYFLNIQTTKTQFCIKFKKKTTKFFYQNTYKHRHSKHNNKILQIYTRLSKRSDFLLFMFF